MLLENSILNTQTSSIQAEYFRGRPERTRSETKAIQTQQINEYHLYGQKDETFDKSAVSLSSNRRFQARSHIWRTLVHHDWRKLWKWIRFDQAIPWYKRNSETALVHKGKKNKNDYRDIERQTDHEIEDRWSDLIIVNKEYLSSRGVRFLRETG